MVATVNRIGTNAFVLKAKYDTDQLELKNKISDAIGLVKKTGKISNVGNLVTKTALTTVENKIPSVSNWLKK